MYIYIYIYHVYIYIYHVYIYIYIYVWDINDGVINFHHFITSLVDVFTNLIGSFCWVFLLTEFGWNLPINGMQTRFSWNSRDRKGICPLVIKRGSDRFPIMEVLYGKSDSQSPHLLSRRYQCLSWNLPTYFYIVFYLYIYIH